eukprot:1067361-Heterocapsa_arctica.AAC.1
MAACSASISKYTDSSPPPSPPQWHQRKSLSCAPPSKEKSYANDAEHDHDQEKAQANVRDSLGSRCPWERETTQTCPRRCSDARSHEPRPRANPPGRWRIWLPCRSTQVLVLGLGQSPACG